MTSPHRLLAVAVLFVFGPILSVGAESAASAPAVVRVVSQSVGTDELLLALAEPGQIAALSNYAREPSYSAVAKEAEAYPALARGDAETILKFRPTLVLAANYSRLELVEQVRRAGVRVIVIDRYRNLEDAFANLRTLARELGGAAPARAEKIVADCTARVKALAARLAGAPRVRVIAPSTYGVVGGADTTFQDLCDHAGAENLAATLGHLVGHQPPPNEQMLTWPIDRVVVMGNSAAEALAPFLKLPPYQFMSAVRERRAAVILPYMLSSVTHHRVAGYEMLARALHPELFKE
ncbi:MAG: ABC transporter substrate-binding protein [Verrucomicrobia bacterium]|nr:ABC transporter substrate-binding protein [Verrucomicrobiota bacterium]